MFEIVEAITYIRSMNSGRTRPCLLECQRQSGEIIEVVAKMDGGASELNETGFFAEAFSSFLARHLGLKIPEPFYVFISPEFRKSCTNDESSSRFTHCSDFIFGSKILPPQYAVLGSGHQPSPEMEQQAVEIFTFDATIVNADRRPDNPNCLTDGCSYALIDHDLALRTEGLIGWVKPWEEGGESDQALREHIFSNVRAKSHLTLDEFAARLTAITPDMIHGFRDHLPRLWVNKHAETMMAYITEVLRNSNTIGINFNKRFHL